MGNTFRTYIVSIERLLPKNLPTYCNYSKIDYDEFMETTKNSKYNPLKMNKSHYIVVTSMWP